LNRVSDHQPPAKAQSRWRTRLPDEPLPKSRTFRLQESNAVSRADITRHSCAYRVLVNGSTRYYVIREAIQATGGSSWVQTMREPEAPILGGTILYVGGRNEIRSYGASCEPYRSRALCTALAPRRPARLSANEKLIIDLVSSFIILSLSLSLKRIASAGV
jgi:hypothetical protein